MLKIVKVSGDSMSPGINPGDFLLITSLPIKLGLLRIGWNMVFFSVDYGLLVKSITGFTIDKRCVFFKGTRPSSLSSDDIGPVSVNDLVGVVLLVFRAKGEKQFTPET